MTPPLALNTLLAAIHVAVNVYQFLLLPAFLLPRNPWWLATLCPLALLSNPLWSLIHETIHGTFHPSVRVNEAAGRLLAVVFGAPWRILKTGHLLHHKLNRSPLERPEAFDPERSSRRLRALPYYAHLFVGLYLLELLSPLAFFLPRRLLRGLRARCLTEDSMASRAAALLSRAEAVRDIRVDGSLIAGGLIASAWLYGSQWWGLIAILGTRTVCISFLDYIYHYGSGVDDVWSAYNLKLPPGVAVFLLNFNLHGVHHRHPRLPWWALPEAFRLEHGRFDGHYVAAALRQLRGPIPLAALRPKEPAPGPEFNEDVSNS